MPGWITTRAIALEKKRGLLSQNVVLGAIRKAASQERRNGIGHRFFKGYTDALIDAGVWRPGRGIVLVARGRIASLFYLAMAYVFFRIGG
jgi:hypothetical protein